MRLPLIRTRIAAVLLAGLAVAAAACGSSSTDAGTAASTTAAPTTTAITKASFVEQANAICKQLNKDSAALGGKPTTNAEWAALITKNVDLIDASTTKIKALPQPTEDSAALQGSYADIDAATALARQLAAAYSSGDETAIQSIGAEVNAAQTKANAAANAYGMTECGKGS